MNFEDSAKIHPEDDHRDLLKNRIDIDIQPAKKKRRFIYYFLIVFITFVISRALLILIVCYTLDFDKLIYNKLFYDSTNPKSFTLDISVHETYSPCFVQVKDIQCTVFRVNRKEEEKHLLDLDIPDIEIIKFKTLTFKDKIYVENLNIGDPVELFNSKYFVGKVKCKLYFRFCLVKWYRTLNLEKKLYLWEHKESPKWDILKKLDVKMDKEGLKLHCVLNSQLLIVPTWVDAFFSDTEFIFCRDLPLFLFVNKQKIVNGRFETSLAGYIFINKENYSDILRSFIKWTRNEKIYLGVENVKTNGRDHFLDISTVLNRETRVKEGLQANPTDENNVDLSSITKEPFIKIEGFDFTNNVIDFNIKLNQNRFKMLKKLGKVDFEGVEINAKLFFFEYLIAKSVFTIISEGICIVLQVKITILDIQKALDSMLKGGKYDYKFVFGDDSEKFSLLKNIVLYHNPNKTLLKYNGDILWSSIDQKELFKKILINHTISSSDDKICVNSKCDLKAPVKGRDVFMFAKKMKVKFEIDHEFFEGSATLNIRNLKMMVKGGVTGNIDIFTEVQPKSIMFQDPNGVYSRLLNSDFKVSVNNQSLIYNYQHYSKFVNRTEKNPLPFKYELIGEYKDYKDLFNHLISFDIKTNDNIPNQSLLTHNFILEDGLISLSLYTKGFPVISNTPNIVLRGCTIRYPFSAEGQKEKPVLNLHIGNLKQIQSLVYGEFYFFSTKNILSYAIAQFLNGKRMQTPDYSDRIIVGEECSFDLKVDTSQPKNSEDIYIYSGVAKLAIPKVVADSFFINVKNIPEISLKFNSEEVKNGLSTFELKADGDAKCKFLSLKFKLNPSLFDAKGQTVTWSISGKESSTITVSSDVLISFFRIFFIKMVAPPTKQLVYEESKLGMFVGYDTFVESGYGKFNTKVDVVIYGDAMEMFFVKMIPKIFLACNFQILPKFFRIKMKSDRLELLNCKLFSKQGEFSHCNSYATKVETEETFLMEYECKLGVDPKKSTEIKSTKPRFVPESVLKNKGKLIFKGLVTFKTNLKENLIVNRLCLDLPFPLLLVNIMKQTNKNTLNVFCRGSILDFAIGLPFSLNVESKDNITYEIKYNNALLIADNLLYDQGEDKYIHLCLDKFNKDCILPFIIDFSNGKNRTLEIELKQGELELLNNKFTFDDSVYVLLHHVIDNGLIVSSKLISQHSDAIISTLNSILGV